MDSGLSRSRGSQFTAAALLHHTTVTSALGGEGAHSDGGSSESSLRTDPDWDTSFSPSSAPPTMAEPRAPADTRPASDPVPP